VGPTRQRLSAAVANIDSGTGTSWAWAGWFPRGPFFVQTLIFFCFKTKKGFALKKFCINLNSFTFAKFVKKGQSVFVNETTNKGKKLKGKDFGEKRNSSHEPFGLPF
jgi:hypothetical protein